MTDLHHQLVICSAENCLGSPARWLPSDLAAIRLYQMMGGRLILETEGSPSSVRQLYRQAGLQLPVLCWEGNWLYSFATGQICGGESLPGRDMRALARDLLEAFPGAAMAILTGGGKVYLPRINRLAHAQLKKEGCLYILSELDSIPAPWYQITFFADPAQFGRIRMYLSEKDFQNYQIWQKDLWLQFLPRGIGADQVLEHIWRDWNIRPENTLWLGCRRLGRETLGRLGRVVAACNAEDAVKEKAVLRLQDSCQGCIGEELYRLCKEAKS